MAANPNTPSGPKDPSKWDDIVTWVVSLYIIGGGVYVAYRLGLIGGGGGGG